MRKSFSLLSLLVATVLFAWLSIAVSAAPNDAKDGEATFKAKCAMCHAPDGSGNSAMGKNMKVRDLRSTEVQAQSDAQLFDLIARGKNKMPSFEKTLGHDKIHNVVAYIRELGKKK